MNNFVLAVEKSDNTKMGVVSATYAPIQSCPKTCPFLDKGCYAQTSFCGIWLRKINKVCEEQKKERPIDIAKEEARRIRELKGDKPLRLHVVGDCRTDAAAKIVSDACTEYTSKNNQVLTAYENPTKSKEIG